MSALVYERIVGFLLFTHPLMRSFTHFFRSAFTAIKTQTTLTTAEG